jgi:hypothetical protein
MKQEIKKVVIDMRKEQVENFGREVVVGIMTRIELLEEANRRGSNPTVLQVRMSEHLKLLTTRIDDIAKECQQLQRMLINLNERRQSCIETPRSTPGTAFDQKSFRQGKQRKSF